MTRGKLRGRIEALEARARAQAVGRVPLSDLSGLLFAVLEVIGEEAGPDVGAACAGRIVEAQAGRCVRLLSGLTAGQLEDVARKTGLPCPDLSGLSTDELIKLYFKGDVWQKQGF